MAAGARSVRDLYLQHAAMFLVRAPSATEWYLTARLRWWVLQAYGLKTGFNVARKDFSQRGALRRTIAKCLREGDTQGGSIRFQLMGAPILDEKYGIETARSATRRIFRSALGHRVRT